MFSNQSKFWKFMYFLPVIPVYVVIYTVVYTFTVFYFLDAAFPFDWFKILMSILFYVFAAMTFVCHSISMLTHPGEVREEIVTELIKNGQMQTPTEHNGLTCKKCKRPRPERAHHCSTCGQCILKMDHHCPWIANCVGYYNQKGFYLFLFYGAFGDLFSCICLIFKICHPSFMHLIMSPKRRINPHAEWIIYEILLSMKEPLLIIIGVTLSFAMAMAMGGLFLYQNYLIINNMTSLESSNLEKKEDSPYYCNKKMTMFKSVLGFGNFFTWFVPTFYPNKINGGYSYEIPDRKNNDPLVFSHKHKEDCKDCHKDTHDGKNSKTNPNNQNKEKGE